MTGRPLPIGLLARLALTALLALGVLPVRPVAARELASLSLDDNLFIGAGYGRLIGDLLDRYGKRVPYVAARTDLHFRYGTLSSGNDASGLPMGLELAADLGWHERPSRKNGLPDAGLHLRLAADVPVRVRLWNSPMLGMAVLLPGIEVARGGLWWADSFVKGFSLGARAAMALGPLPLELEARWLPAFWATQDVGAVLDRTELRLLATTSLGPIGLGAELTRGWTEGGGHSVRDLGWSALLDVRW